MMKKQLLNLSLVITAVVILSAQVIKAQVDDTEYHTPVNTMEVPKVLSSNMTVDGIAEGIYGSEQSIQYIQTNDDDGDAVVTFQTAYSSEYLYVIFHITDDIGHFVDTSDLSNNWQYDAAEIFTEASHVTGDEGAYLDDAIQLRYNRTGNDAVAGPLSFTPTDNWAAKEDSLGVDFEENWVWIDDGVDAPTQKLEVAIPWAAILDKGKTADDLGEYVGSGMLLGFDASYIDSDGSGIGGARDYIIHWDDDETGIGDGWQDTRSYGTISLQDIEAVEPTQVSSNDVKFSVDGKTITFSEEVEVFNTLGQLIGKGKVVTVPTSDIYIANGTKIFIK